MSLSAFGGNTVSQPDLTAPGKHLFGAGPYEYYLYRTSPGETLMFDALGSFTVYVLKAPTGVGVRVVGMDAEVMQGDSIQAEDCAVELRTEAAVEVLVAGTTELHGATKGCRHIRHADLYRVQKPWGHEIWINGQHPRYALKQIFVKQGTKTSLQYHRFKQETNVLFEGTAKLHYKADPSVPNEEVTAKHLADVAIMPVGIIGVTPPTLHRLEAVTDILLYETSTPHLDDVIRVQDDTARPDGRIVTEHQQ